MNIININTNDFEIKDENCKIIINNDEVNLRINGNSTIYDFNECDNLKLKIDVLENSSINYYMFSNNNFKNKIIEINNYENSITNFNYSFINNDNCKLIINNNIIKHIDGSEFILLEANYDPEILKYTKYPFKLKSRIAGPTGHLSNQVAGQTINYLIKSGLKNAILGHLSKESNFPELAYQTVVDELISNGTNLDNFNLSIASRDVPGKLLNI